MPSALSSLCLSYRYLYFSRLYYCRGLVSRMKALSDKSNATPREMYDSHGASESILRCQSFSEESKQENSEIQKSVKHKMIKINGESFFGIATKVNDKQADEDQAVDIHGKSFKDPLNLDATSSL